MSLHGFTAVFALLGDGSLCVCVCHGKMYKGLSTSESLGLLCLCFCIF